MAQFNEAWVEHQRLRWMRPDANRWLRPDASRYLQPQTYNRKYGLAQSPLHADDPDLDWRTETAIRRAQGHVSAACVELALKKLAQAWCKANFNPNQPRAPAGQPDGGQWTSEAGTPLAGDTPGIGHNQGPPLDDPPEIPGQKPVAVTERNAFLKAAAQWLARAFRIGGPVGYFLSAMEAASWLDTDRAFIDAYQAPPKTLEELQQAVETPKLGYDVHHIVEQTPARDAEYPEELIDAPENLVRIPTLKHWEINGWYSEKNYGEKFQGRPPREYLRDKDWDERTRVGLEALTIHGVLKP